MKESVSDKTRGKTRKNRNEKLSDEQILEDPDLHQENNTKDNEKTRGRKRERSSSLLRDLSTSKRQCEDSSEPIIDNNVEDKVLNKKKLKEVNSKKKKLSKGAEVLIAKKVKPGFHFLQCF